MLEVVLVGALTFGMLVVVSPEAAAWVAAKEGPLEHVGHLVLVAGVVAWIVAARRMERDATFDRRVAIGLALTCAAVLGEELDWGAVYGVGSLGNLHNAWSGASYLVFAMLPVGLIGVVGWRRGDDAPGRLPRRRDALGLVLLGGGTLAAVLLWPAGEPLVDEVSETLLYGALLWMALRPVKKTG